MEKNSLVCSPLDEDIFAKLFPDVEITIDKGNQPSRAHYVDEEGICFTIRLDKETKEGKMYPTGKMVTNHGTINFPMANIMKHLKQREERKSDN